MVSKKLNQFLEQIAPFAAAAIDDAGENSNAFRQELGVKLPSTVSLTVQALWLVAAAKVYDNVALRLLPNSEKVQEQSHKLNLRIVDCMLGVRLHEIRPLTMARKMPETLRTMEFADYAHSLSLPHIASIIEAGVKHLPPPATPAP